MKKLLFFIQILLGLACVVLGILYLCGYEFLDILEIVVASDLLVLGVSSLAVTKNKKYALVYFIVSGLMLIAVILKMVGVHF